METRSGRSLREGQYWLIDRSHKFDLYDHDNGVCGGVAIIGADAIISQSLQSFTQHWAQAHNIPLTRFKPASADKHYGEGTWSSVEAFINNIHAMHDICYSTKKVLKRFKNLAFIKSFTDVYTLSELEKLFQNFSDTVEKTGLQQKTSAFFLGDSQHSICVSYDGTNKQWSLIDANQLPPKTLSTASELAQRVVEALFTNDPLIISISLYCHKADELAFKKLSMQWSSPNRRQVTKTFSEKEMEMLDPRGSSLLYVAALYGDTFTVENLLRSGMDPNLSRKRDNRTALHICGEMSHADTAAILIKYGAKLDQRNKYGTPALFTAAENGDAEMVQLLCEGGADKNQTDTHFESTPFLIAAARGKIKVLNVLLKFGIDINQIDKFSKMTALHLAVGNGHAHVVRYLLDHGADASSRNWCRDTPYKHALKCGQNEIADLLKAYHERRSPFWNRKLTGMKRRCEDDDLSHEQHPSKRQRNK